MNKLSGSTLKGSGRSHEHACIYHMPFAKFIFFCQRAACVQTFSKAHSNFMSPRCTFQDFFLLLNSLKYNTYHAFFGKPDKVSAFGSSSIPLGSKKIIWLTFDIQLLNRLERSSSIFIEYCCKLQIAIIRFMDCSWTWFGANCSHGWLVQLIMGVTRLKRAWNLV